ncbi:MAG: type II toxin-antitoxin system RelE/ParE family toxin [Chitinophagales bacterium]
MSKIIVWTETAQKERKSIFLYWNENNQSKTYSRKLNKHFNEGLKKLSKNPFIGKRTSVINVRAKIIKEYMLFYEITEKHIVVLSIWDCRQNPIKQQIKF